MNARLSLIPLFALLAACRDPGSSSHARTPHETATVDVVSLPVRAAVSDARGLPDRVEGFVPGPLQREHGFERRTYTRGDSRITVTLAMFPMTEEGYAEWLRQSASYPQAVLDVPAGRGNGFYQCAERGSDPHCSLLVQLRSGTHLEIQGEGSTTRSDLDAIARALPLRVLAGEAPASESVPEGSAANGTSRAISFARDVLPVLVRECAAVTGCHGDQHTGRTDLDLRAESAYRTLVGRPSRERRTALLVDPGNPARSFLVDKMTLDSFVHGEGRRMPLDVETGLARTDQPLADWTARILVPWIAQGAREN